MNKLPLLFCVGINNCLSSYKILIIRKPASIHIRYSQPPSLHSYQQPAFLQIRFYQLASLHIGHHQSASLHNNLPLLLLNIMNLPLFKLGIINLPFFIQCIVTSSPLPWRVFHPPPPHSFDKDPKLHTCDSSFLPVKSSPGAELSH